MTHTPDTPSVDVPRVRSTDALATALHSCEIIPGSWNCSYHEEGIAYADCPNRLAHVAFAQRILAALPDDAAVVTVESLAEAYHDWMAGYCDHSGDYGYEQECTSNATALIKAHKEAQR